MLIKVCFWVATTFVVCRFLTLAVGVLPLKPESAGERGERLGRLFAKYGAEVAGFLLAIAVAAKIIFQ